MGSAIWPRFSIFNSGGNWLSYATPLFQIGVRVLPGGSNGGLDLLVANAAPHFLIDSRRRNMEQANRSAIIVLARAGHSAAEIARQTRIPSSTVYDVYNAFKETGKEEAFIKK